MDYVIGTVFGVFLSAVYVCRLSGDKGCNWLLATIAAGAFSWAIIIWTFLIWSG